MLGLVKYPVNLGSVFVKCTVMYNDKHPEMQLSRLLWTGVTVIIGFSVTFSLSEGWRI